MELKIEICQLLSALSKENSRDDLLKKLPSELNTIFNDIEFSIIDTPRDHNPNIYPIEGEDKTYAFLLSETDDPIDKNTTRLVSNLTKITGVFIERLELRKLSREKTSQLNESETKEDNFDKGKVAIINLVAELTDEIERRVQSEKELIKTEERSRALLNAIPDLMFRFSKDGVILDYKSDTDDLYTKNTEELLNKNIVDLLPPYLSDLTIKSIADTIRSKNLHIYEYDLEIPGKGNQTFEARMVPIGNDEVISTVRNITEKKKFERSLIENEEKLRKANMTKDKFFSIIAHDLRNPFCAILGACDMLSIDFKKVKTDEIRLCIETIKDSANNTYQLLENLLAWSRTQTGNIEFIPDLFDLNELAASEVLNVKKLAANKKITIINEIENEIMVYADRQMIDFIIRNLLMNGIKFTRRKGAVKLNAVEKENSIIISVSDNGIGMSDDKITNLFKLSKKVSTLGTEREKGTGLGLLLCKEFVELNKGKIWVESEVNEGSKFHFSIPSANNL